MTTTDGPLRVFSPAFVGSLSKDQPAQIAGEGAEGTDIRAEITRELRILQDGHTVLNGATVY